MTNAQGSWRLVETNDLQLVRDLHVRTFQKPLEDEILKPAGKETTVCLFLVVGADDKEAGFAICAPRGKEVELLRLGIVPEKRLKGAATAALNQLEQHFAASGTTSIRADLFNSWNVALSKMILSGYRVTGIEYDSTANDNRLTLLRVVRPRKELRFALTQVCNFDCIFCHNEGLEKGRTDSNLTHSEVLETLMHAIELGHTDITLTGGEPLIERSLLFFLLEGLGQLPQCPDLTVVTNGFLLSEDAVRHLLAYPGNLKVHVSLHASDPESFAKITRMKSPKTFKQVVANVRRATEMGLKVKVNHVLLQGINNDRIPETIDFVHELGACALKIIELLVLPDSHHDFKHYYQVKAIEPIVEKVATLNRRDQRRSWYRLNKDSSFAIDVERCTCAVGCTACRTYRDRQLDAELRYHPCFAHAKCSYPTRRQGELESALTKGDSVIDKLISQYGDASPSVLRPEVLIPNKIEFFYVVRNHREFAAFLKEKGFDIRFREQFLDVYFRPRLCGTEWTSFNKVLRIDTDSYNQSQADLLYADYEYVDRGPAGLEVRTYWLFPDRKPRPYSSLEEARHILDKLDFEEFGRVNGDITAWRNREGLEISVFPTMGEEASVKVVAREEELAPFKKLFDAFPGHIEPLRESFHQYLLRNCSERRTA